MVVHSSALALWTPVTIYRLTSSEGIGKSICSYFHVTCNSAQVTK